ncbi:PP2C family protein-serine/threonine phosphatase [Nocardia sp. NPDC055321]
MLDDTMTMDSSARIGGFELGGASRIGARSVNMDAYTWAAHPDHTTEHAIVVAIADGVGKSFGSETIAHGAVSVACQLAVYSEFRLTPAHIVDYTRTELPRRLRSYAELGHAHALDDFAHCAGTCPDTTLVVAVITPTGRLSVGWRGDSRAYIRTTSNPRLQQVTADHNDPAAPNQLLRSLLDAAGTGEFSCPITDDRVVEVVLCTDGVHGVLTDDEIGTIAAASPSAHNAAIAVTGKAVAAGGDHADNASMVIIRITHAPE